MNQPGCFGSWKLNGICLACNASHDCDKATKKEKPVTDSKPIRCPDCGAKLVLMGKRLICPSCDV